MSLSLFSIACTIVPAFETARVGHQADLGRIADSKLTRYDLLTLIDIDSRLAYSLIAAVLISPESEK